MKLHSEAALVKILGVLINRFVLPFFNFSKCEIKYVKESNKMECRYKGRGTLKKV